MIEIITSEDGQTRYKVRSELRGLPASYNSTTRAMEWPTFDDRALAESALRMAWAKDGLEAWDLLQEVTVLVEMVRSGGEDQVNEDDMHRILSKRLASLRDMVWTIVQEGPCTLFSVAGGEAFGDKLAGDMPEHIADAAAAEHHRLVAIAKEARKASERPTFEALMSRYLRANRPASRGNPGWIWVMQSLEKLDGYAELSAAHDANQPMPERELALFQGRVLAMFDRLVDAAEVAIAKPAGGTSAARKRTRAVRAATTTKRRTAAK